MSFGSYSGAGFKEKITWSKVEPGSFGMQIFGDYTEHFPDIAALILEQ
jgi:deoxyhypusine synthase